MPTKRPRKVKLNRTIAGYPAFRSILGWKININQVMYTAKKQAGFWFLWAPNALEPCARSKTITGCITLLHKRQPANQQSTTT